MNFIPFGLLLFEVIELYLKSCLLLDLEFFLE